MLARELGVVFGDGRALDEVRKIALDRNAPPDQRRAAVRNLVDARPKDLLPLLHQLLGDRDTAGAALKGLAVLDDPETAKIVLGRYPHLRAEDRAEALDTLASRPEYALALLRTVEKGQLPRSDIAAHLARQIAGYGNKELTALLTRVWGEVRETPAQQKEQLLQWKKTLVPDYLAKANLGAGRLLFAKSCAACHRLFGEGQIVGPDLTGSDRRNLDYLLENILTPSAVVPADFRMSVVEMKNGRVINGVLGARTPQTQTVQTPTEKLVLDRSEIESIQPTPQSLMPDGLLNGLTHDQVRDLFGYLMAERPVLSAR